MALPYGNFMDYLTLAPGDWDNPVKEEPLSPESAQELRHPPCLTRQVVESPSPNLSYPDMPIPAGQPPELTMSSSSAENVEEESNGTEAPEPEIVFDDSLDRLMSFNPCSFLQMTPQEQQEVSKIVEMPRHPEFPLNPLMIRHHQMSYENGFSDQHIIREEGHIPRPMDFCLPQMFMNPNTVPSAPFQATCDPFILGAASNEFKQFSKKTFPLFGGRFPNLTQNIPPRNTGTPSKIRRPRIKHSRKYGHILWKFILELLMNPMHGHVIRWTGKRLAFKIVDKAQLSRLWSQAKVRQNNVKISYESITRALRSYKPKPKEAGKPAIISHSMDSNFTYFFNDYYRHEIAEECKLPFEDLLAYAKCASLEHK